MLYMLITSPFCHRVINAILFGKRKDSLCCPLLWLSFPPTITPPHNCYLGSVGGLRCIFHLNIDKRGQPKTGIAYHHIAVNYNTNS